MLGGDVGDVHMLGGEVGGFEAVSGEPEQSRRKITDTFEAPVTDDFESYEGTTFFEAVESTPGPGLGSGMAEGRATGELAPTVLVNLLQGDKLFLDPGSVTTIGRAKDALVSLPSPKVSRYHAEIRCDGNGYSIHDLNSTNGTFVNDTRVHRRRRLRSGAKIDVGPFSFRLVELSSPNDPVDAEELADAGTETSHDLGAALAGKLEETSIAELVQFIETTGKTGQLTLFRRDGQGRVWVSGGAVIHAEFGELYGVPACLQLFGMTHGRFELITSEVNCPRTVRQPTMHLLMEAARVRDEEEGEGQPGA